MTTSFFRSSLVQPRLRNSQPKKPTVTAINTQLKFLDTASGLNLTTPPSTRITASSTTATAPHPTRRTCRSTLAAAAGSLGRTGYRPSDDRYFPPVVYCTRPRNMPTAAAPNPQCQEFSGEIPTDARIRLK